MAYTRGGGYVFLTRSGERERAALPVSQLTASKSLDLFDQFISMAERDIVSI